MSHSPLQHTQRCRLVSVSRLLASIIFIVLTPIFLPNNIRSIQRHDPRGDPDSGQTCVQPQLQLWHPEIRRLYPFPPAPLRCSSSEENWAYTANGTFFISSGAVARHGRIDCRCIAILRGGDDFRVKRANVSVVMRSGDTLTTDVFEVQCRAADGAAWSMVLSGVAPSAAVRRRHKKRLPARVLGLDVLMLGFDSVSRLTWMRYLPRSYAYFKGVLGGVVLEGYNIVGDGTARNLQPLLTGRKESELPESRRGFANARTVDEHPWIWKDFQKLGYATQWGEDTHGCQDSHGCGTFTMRFVGFQEQPVDHYLRTYYLATQKVHRKRYFPFCHGSKSLYANMLNWMRDFVDVYSNQRKFSFVFHSEYSHEGTNELQLADNDLLEFLRHLHDRGHLENAVLMLVCDHGARFRQIRNIEQGKQEERNPFFGVRLPPRFIHAHPSAARNLATNAKRLTTAFDVHATLRDIVDFESNHAVNSKQIVPFVGRFLELFRQRKSMDIGTQRSILEDDITRKASKSPVMKMSRGISLFKEIPRSRSCADADIEPHFCACLRWENISVTEPSVLKAAQHVVNSINGVTERLRELCAPLTLARISKAFRYSANDHVLKFFNTDEVDWQTVNMNDNMTTTEALLQLTLQTSPGGALYEATLRYYRGRSGEDSIRAGPLMDDRSGHPSTAVLLRKDHYTEGPVREGRSTAGPLEEDRFAVELSSISRINRYGDQPHCVAARLPHLRAYCSCKVQR